MCVCCVMWFGGLGAATVATFATATTTFATVATFDHGDGDEHGLLQLLMAQTNASE